MKRIINIAFKILNKNTMLHIRETYIHRHENRTNVDETRQYKYKNVIPENNVTINSVNALLQLKKVPLDMDWLEPIIWFEDTSP